MRRIFVAALFVLAAFLAVSPQACTFRAEPSVRELAEQGDARSQYRLAIEYKTGKGEMDRDFAMSWYWFNKALETGLPGDLDEMAHKSLQELEATATPEEIEKGRRMLEAEQRK